MAHTGLGLTCEKFAKVCSGSVPTGRPDATRVGNTDQMASVLPTATAAASSCYGLLLGKSPASSCYGLLSGWSALTEISTSTSLAGSDWLFVIFDSSKGTIMMWSICASEWCEAEALLRHSSFHMWMTSSKQSHMVHSPVSDERQATALTHKPSTYYCQQTDIF